MDDGAGLGTTRRYVALIGITLFVTAALGVLGWYLRSSDHAAGGLPVAQLSVGDCFEYPGDGVEMTAVQAISCDEVHYGEVYATTAAGDAESCVDLFEAYTGFENYWASDYIIGFLDVDDSRMHCYLYAARDFAGSLAG